jgi:hypothetical protein
MEDVGCRLLLSIVVSRPRAGAAQGGIAISPEAARPVGRAQTSVTPSVLSRAPADIVAKTSYVHGTVNLYHIEGVSEA